LLHPSDSHSLLFAKPGRLRNIIIHTGLLVICPEYNKSSTYRAIARFPDSVTAALLILHISLLQPLTFVIEKELRAAGVSHAPDPAPEASACVFTLNGAPLSGTQVCAIFKRVVTRYVLSSGLCWIIARRFGW